MFYLEGFSCVIYFHRLPFDLEISIATTLMGFKYNLHLMVFMMRKDEKSSSSGSMYNSIAVSQNSVESFKSTNLGLNKFIIR